MIPFGVTLALCTTLGSGNHQDDSLWSDPCQLASQGAFPSCTLWLQTESCPGRTAAAAAAASEGYRNKRPPPAAAAAAASPAVPGGCQHQLPQQYSQRLSAARGARTAP
eukprot:scaffold144370_cov18-Tisochrysis_lutea.AAC.2